MKSIKRKLKIILSYLLIPVLRLFYNSKIIYAILRLDPIIINKNKKNLLTMHLRPSKDFAIKEVEDNYSNIGIIIQGPIVYEEDFTLNTIKLYKKLFKGATIVLSTWDTEDKNYLKNIYSQNIEVILNKYPKNSGILNLNYQITNTKSAVNYLQDKCEFILKTRTDSRIYCKESLQYLVNMIKIFPSRGNYDQKFRIIGLDINTTKYIPFSFSDVLQFGHSSDMKKMWDIDLCGTNLTYKDFFSLKLRVKDVYHSNNPEVYLTINYLERIGFDTENSYESYYEALSKFFIVIDKEMLNYFWLKYSIDEYYWVYKYKDYNLQEKVRFNDWLLYYSSYPNMRIDYSYFDEQL